MAAQRYRPAWPATLIVRAGSIAISAALGLADHGVDTVGELPRALPDPSWPDVHASDMVDLIAPAFGVLLVTADAALRDRG